MPLPNDEGILKVSEDLIAGLEAVFGQHPGFRPAHAKGRLVTGTFTPAPAAATLSNAPHFTNPSTPITVRFSSSTGIPAISDTDPNANPRGVGIRFNLGHRVHTDIVAHSAPGFPTHTGAEFLEFLHAIAASGAPGVTSPTPVEKFLGAHPAALAYVQIPKPAPTSFANEAFFGVTAFKFTNAEGVTKFGRYLIVPEAGESHVQGDELADKSPTFLFDELPEHLAKGPISYTLRAQIAQEGDVTDDATVHWPEDRPVVELGKLQLDALLPDNDKEQKYIIYDPIPRVQGIAASDDPLLEVRAAVYLISGRRRRAAA